MNRRTIHSLGLKLRVTRLIAKGLVSRDHPVLVHMIPTRRCNLSCRYCNEYDSTSPPVPVKELLRRVDLLAKLGTSIITQSGGEPLLHPNLEEVIARVRGHGIVAGLITNGYLLTAKRIKQLNKAGLDHLQMSIDNVMPDDISKKSLKVLNKKLELLAEYAEFQVNVNSVLGAGIANPEDAAVVARRAVELGFMGTVGVIHDGFGQLRALNATQRKVFDEISSLATHSFGRINRLNPYQRNLVEGKPNDWWVCRAGARYLYLCEDGLVHYCSQQRGAPGIPLENYTVENIRREYRTRKTCAPYCTISCVHQVSIMDRWRDPQPLLYDPAALSEAADPPLVRIQS
jgi:MoaA/NifB/PqqE/SkfB family radical SAM enzyme